MQMGGKDGDKLRCRRLDRQRTSGNLFQGLPVQPPRPQSDRADISLHRAGRGMIPLCHFGIKPLCDEKQPLRIFHCQQNGIGRVKESGIIRGNPQLLQDAVYRRNLGVRIVRFRCCVKKHRFRPFPVERCLILPGDPNIPQGTAVLVFKILAFFFFGCTIV